VGGARCEAIPYPHRRLLIGLPIFACTAAVFALRFAGCPEPYDSSAVILANVLEVWQILWIFHEQIMGPYVP
jgi:hypothetical protein